MNLQRIILAGGSGFLGNALAQRYCERGNEVIVLTRTPRARADGVKEIVWDAKSPGDWAKFVDGAEAVINLTGRSVLADAVGARDVRRTVWVAGDGVDAGGRRILFARGNGTHSQKPPRGSGTFAGVGVSVSIPGNETGPEATGRLAVWN